MNLVVFSIYGHGVEGNGKYFFLYFIKNLIFWNFFEFLNFCDVRQRRVGLCPYMGNGCVYGLIWWSKPFINLPYVIRKEQSDNSKRIPKHFYYGPRKLNVILTHLRNSCSFLNYDLSKINIVNDAACSCGAPQEDAFYYFFTCPNYAEIRLIMMNNLNWVQTRRFESTNLWVGWFNIRRKY